MIGCACSRSCRPPLLTDHRVFLPVLRAGLAARDRFAARQDPLALPGRGGKFLGYVAYGARLFAACRGAVDAANSELRGAVRGPVVSGGRGRRLLGSGGRGSADQASPGHFICLPAMRECRRKIDLVDIGAFLRRLRSCVHVMVQRVRIPLYAIGISGSPARCCRYLGCSRPV